MTPKTIARNALRKPVNRLILKNVEKTRCIHLADRHRSWSQPLNTKARSQGKI
jgi:hypothetical protein